MEKYMNILLRLSKKAYKKSEIPVACIILCNGKIVSKAYNKREKYNNVIGHAEIIALRKAARKKKTWKLDDCELFVTLEPCDMCKKIIEESRIKKVSFFVDKTKQKNNKKGNVVYKKINLENDYSKLLISFFKTIRK